MNEAAGQHQRTIRGVTLWNFKGFDHFSAALGKTAIMVGPNSAGKTTLVECLHAVAAMLRYAGRHRPATREVDDSVAVIAYDIGDARTGVGDENFRFNFRDEREVRMQVEFGGGASLTAVWPPAEGPRPFFYLTRREHPQPKDAKTVRDVYPVIAVVPHLSPVERFERLLAEDYLKEFASLRLASRHFRNLLYLMSRDKPSEFDEYLSYCSKYCPELQLFTPKTSMADKGVAIDFYYAEHDHFKKELCWAGDGFQVWLQLLYHVYAMRGADCIVLDEPDVYLHPDLQRRLVRVLDETAAQCIIATHSSELMLEASPQSVLLIDRLRRRALRLTAADAVDDATQALGTAFNMRLARALRANLSLFVEGDDMRVLRNLARKLGADRVANEDGVVVVPLHGADNWRKLSGLKWILGELLHDAMRAFIVLDRDFHSDTYMDYVRDELRAANVGVHFWSRHELENYLIVPEAISRRSNGATPSDVEAIILAATESLKSQSFGMAAAMRFDERSDRGQSVAELSVLAHRDCEEWWSDETKRLARVPGKELLSAVNAELQRRKFKPVSARALSQDIRRGELDPELSRVILRCEQLAG